MIRSLLISAALASTALAQLPVITLDTVFPPGGQVGQTIDLAFAGADQDELGQIHFSHPGLTSPAPNRVAIGADVPPGIYELRVSGRFGLSNPRAFVVDAGPALPEKAPNQAREQAMPIALGQAIYGRANADQLDWFKFTAKKGQAVTIETLAERIDSRMDTALVLRDSSGQEIARANDVIGRDAALDFDPPADGEYFLHLADFLYQGDGNQYFYRLSLTEKQACSERQLRGHAQAADFASRELSPQPREATATQAVTVPGEFRGVLASNEHTFDLPAKKGDALVAEVFSDRLGERSDFKLTAYKLDKDNKPVRLGESDDQPDESGHPGFPTGSRDPYYRWQADADATYRVLLSNQFARAAKYQLVVRAPKPDFHLFAVSENPTDAQEKVSLWTPRLRRGDATDLEIIAVRRDGFAEAIELSAEALPPGVTCAGGRIPAGQSKARLILEAAKDAATWAGAIKIVGQGKSGEQSLRTEAVEGTHVFSVNNVNSERYESRLTATVGLAVIGVEDAPVALSAKAEAYEMSLAGQLEIPLQISRQGEQVGNFTVTPVSLAGLTKPPTASFDPKATEAKLALNLTNKDGNNFKPGEYIFCLRAENGQVKYRANPQAQERAEAEKQKRDGEAATAEAKVKELKAKKEGMAKELAALNAGAAKGKQAEIAETDKAIAEAEKALQAATQAKEAAGKAWEAAKNRAAPKDLKHAFYSRPIRLKITEAPIQLAEISPVKIAPGAKVELPVSLERLYGFAEEVTLELTPPKEAKELADAKGTIAKEAKETKLSLAAGPETEPGLYSFSLLAKLKFHGQDLTVKRTITVEVGS